MIIHVTHNDMDGAGCSILLKSVYKNIDTFYLNYDEVDDFILNNFVHYDRIIITDVSPGEELLKHLINRLEITLIDHHISSENLKSYDFTIHETGKSATKLTYEWLLSENKNVKKFHDLVECINDYDLWLLQNKKSLKMNMLFTLFGIDRFVKRFLCNPSTAFAKEEKLLLELEEESQNKYFENSEKHIQVFTDKWGRTFGCIFAEKYNSELGNYLLQKMQLQYIFIINAQKRKVSLRSIPTVSVNDIAEANNGGGHKNAAGFSTDYDFGMKDFLKKSGVLK